MLFKKFALVFYILYSVIICSCDDMMVEYTFINKSSFTIQLTLSEPYKYENSKEANNITSPFSVYTGRETTVYVQKRDVDFHWTTINIGDNSKVYCTTNGSKATFGDR